MVDTELRIRGREAISTALTNKKNISVLENAIFSQTTDEQIYIRTILQATQDIRDKNVSLKQLLTSIKEGKIGWNHPCHKIRKNKLQEHDDYLNNPFEIEEGALDCPKCKSGSVHSYSQQTRSGDESTTVFAWCMKCNYKWVS